jgi:hypothetical protein
VGRAWPGLSHRATFGWCGWVVRMGGHVVRVRPEDLAAYVERKLSG